MPSVTVHDFETVWTSDDPALLDGTITSFRVRGTGSLQLTARAGAAGVTATHTPAAPLDLSAYGELRLWAFGNRVADGTTRRPFLMEFGYTDAGDEPDEEHRWLIPVNRAGTWEQHRFGIDGDRRGQITSMWVRCLTGQPFQLRLDELLAVDEAPLSDVEAELTALFDAMPLPGVTALPVEPAALGADTLVVPLNRRLHAANRLTLSNTTSRYTVLTATHDEPGGTTTLTIQPALAEAAGPGVTLSVIAPVVFEEAPFAEPEEPANLPDPVLLITLTDQREEPERGWNIAQRDSFRPRGALTACSVRPPARPVLAEYQILPAAGDRGHSLALRSAVLLRVGIDTGLRVNGRVLPARTLLPPPLDVRVRAVPAPIYLHIGTRVETGPRVELPWVRSGQVLSGPLTGPMLPDPVGDEPPPVPGPDDQEGIVLRI